MGRRKKPVRRKTRPGRKVYYRPLGGSHSKAKEAPTKQEMFREFNGTARVSSDASFGARELREQKSLEKTIRVFGLSDTAEHMEVLNKLRHLRTMESMDSHVVVHNSLKSVCILFHDKTKTKFWFVERNKLNNTVRCSITYGTWSQAYGMFQVDAILFKD